MGNLIFSMLDLLVTFIYQNITFKVIIQKIIRIFLNIKIPNTTGCHRKIPSVHSWHFLLNFNDFWNFRL